MTRPKDIHAEERESCREYRSNGARSIRGVAVRNTPFTHRRSASTNFYFETIRRRISDGECPGAKPTEMDLAEEFRVSRTPLRQVLHWLDLFGL
ncbi:GntR family transcriptional regulator [Paraburkholderia sp. UYCP14C]|nr:GntR family transcriptional regulator [Paraburkholderia sp. UYCP14C]